MGALFPALRILTFNSVFRRSGFFGVGVFFARHDPGTGPGASLRGPG
ncbi:MAG: hypothetical protein LBR53_03175 [Deltaproteobacteria bacterium]|nr:hypothetical protein [Deltaproteobacteria bacterium]